MAMNKTFGFFWAFVGLCAEAFWQKEGRAEISRDTAKMALCRLFMEVEVCRRLSDCRGRWLIGKQVDQDAGDDVEVMGGLFPCHPFCHWAINVFTRFALAGSLATLVFSCGSVFSS